MENIARNRAKKLKMSISEDLIKQIVIPFVEFTAYLLSVENTNEMPALNTMIKSLEAPKLVIARCLALKIQRSVNPKKLTEVSITVHSSGGYFELTCLEEYLDNNAIIKQPWNINFTDSGKVTLIEKLITTESVKFPNKTREDVIEAAIKKMSLI